jgi:hypothetical protein
MTKRAGEGGEESAAKKSKGTSEFEAVRAPSIEFCKHMFAMSLFSYICCVHWSPFCGGW